MEIYLAKTQGFCGGVSFAVTIVEKMLEKYGAPVYVYHDIVHNTHVVNDFKKRGVIFVESLADVPSGKHIVFSAHGVPPSIVQEAQKRNLAIIDATCPLVAKVHREAVKYSQKNIPVILVGHKNHQEVIGTAGYVQKELLSIVETEKDIAALSFPCDSSVGVITQTTLSVDETKYIIEKLRKKYPKLVLSGSSDLCYATQNRQDAVKELAKKCDFIIVCGSKNSSNSNRLREIGEQCGVKSIIVDSVDDFDVDILENKKCVGITSGASVPRFVVEDIVKRIEETYLDVNIHCYSDPEKNITFKLPEI
ncbi:MAG TPA: 4-hydroxy-3-methylbut-2-enyl diphosphate reductase [Candidatus Omnitrophota bacterium]|nr:4-hydroxy-3-methylbut-2-enyl diphosphate reductase [Candidatus Omnitrophota bacterium]